MAAMTLLRPIALGIAFVACWVTLRMLGISLGWTEALLLPGFAVLVWCWSDKR